MLHVVNRKFPPAFPPHPAKKHPAKHPTLPCLRPAKRRLFSVFGPQAYALPSNGFISPPLNEVLRVDLPQPLLRKGRTGAVAEQPFQPLPVVGFDAHAGIERKTAVVLSTAYGLAIGLVQNAAPNKEADDPFPNRRLQLYLPFQRDTHFLKAPGLGILSRKQTVDHDYMKVQMDIEHPAKAVDEDDGADARITLRVRKTLPQPLFDGMQKAVQCGVLQFGGVEKVAQTFGE